MSCAALFAAIVVLAVLTVAAGMAMGLTRSGELESSFGAVGLLFALGLGGLAAVCSAGCLASACAPAGRVPPSGVVGGGKPHRARRPQRAAPAPVAAPAAPADCDELNPPLKVVDYPVRGPSGEIKTLRVIRDDLLPMGTKQRAIIPYLRGAVARANAGRPADDPVTTILYTAPYNGYSPVATALGAKALGLRCRLVMSLFPYGGDKAATPEEALDSVPVRLALERGAEVEFAPNWPALVAAGKAAAASPGTLWLPLGMDEPDFNEALAAALAAAARGRVGPGRVWSAGGSGVISVAIATALPGAQVRVVPVVLEADGAPPPRLLAALRRRPNLSAEGRHAPELATPYPTVHHYDSRAWEAAVEWGEDGDFVWNVAGEAPGVPPLAPGASRVGRLGVDPALGAVPAPLPGADEAERHSRFNADGGPLARTPFAAPAGPPGGAPLPPGLSVFPPAGPPAEADRAAAELASLFAAPGAGAVVRKASDTTPSFLFFHNPDRSPWLANVDRALRRRGLSALADRVRAELARCLGRAGPLAAGAADGPALRLYIEKASPGDGYRWHVDKVADRRGGPIFVVTFGAPTVFDFAPLEDAAAVPVRVEVGGGGASFCLDGPARFTWAHMVPHVGGTRYNLVFDFGQVFDGAAAAGHSRLFGLPVWQNIAISR